MTTPAQRAHPPDGKAAKSNSVWSTDYLATTIGTFALCALVAFEATAVTTIMPTVARELDGVDLYSLAFAAPLASAVVGMVAAGSWADRHGPARPLVVSLILFCVGLVTAGVAPNMEILLLARLCQGLGGGALTVGLYVLVGLVYPPRLRASIFALFAAAWVLPTLFGPALAAGVADWFGWRWVFLGSPALALLAAALVIGPLRRTGPPDGYDDVPVSEPDARPDARPVSRPVSRQSQIQVLWAVVAAGAVLALELLGSVSGVLALGALAALVLLAVSVGHLTPAGTLVARRGLPAVIGTRGMLSASFLCAEAYIVFVFEERWGLTPTVAGLALTVVGTVWAASSQLQAALGDRVSDHGALQIGSALVLLGAVGVAIAVVANVPAVVAGLPYVLAGAGMGFAYPRTGVAMLAASAESERGANSSALSVADSLGAAVALSASGVVFAAAPRVGLDGFVAVYFFASVLGGLAVLTAARTRPSTAHFA